MRTFTLWYGKYPHDGYGLGPIRAMDAEDAMRIFTIMFGKCPAEVWRA